MPRILLGVSPIGLGHATRSLVLKGELERRGAEVRVFSGGVAAEFFWEAGVGVVDIVDDPVPKVSAGEMRDASLWYVRSWLANRRTVKRTERLFDSRPHDLVVCDEEFSGIVVAERRREKRVFVSDELELGFARSWLARLLEKRVEGWYRRLQRTVDLLIVTEDGVDSGNVRHVGPIVRAPTAPCPAVRRKFGLGDGKLVLASMSGSGIGRELVEKLAGVVPDDASLVVTGNRGAKLAGERVRDLGVVLDNQDLVACADLVVTTAGKSTIDEAAAAGTPVIAIPIRHHAEQERNAASLGYTSEDADRLGDLVRRKMGQRGAPKRYAGEKEAADAILSLIA